MNVDDWILWVNDNGWYPKNVQEVESKGLELMTQLNYSLWGLKAASGFNYSYTSTERKKSQTNSSAIGRQMEYVPLHSGNVYSTLTYKNTNFSIDCKYTDQQFTNEEDKNILSSYFLLNFSVGHQFKLNDKNRIKIKGLVNNILDADYQSTYGYAMPGVNYRLSLTYNIN